MFSIIIPLYNSSSYISECINSITKQSLQDFEIIVIDDCSSDDSYQIVNSLRRNDERIKLFLQRNNAGAGAARNIGLTMAKGEYVLFLDSDDYITNKNALLLLDRKVRDDPYDIVFFKHKIVNPITNEISDMLTTYERSLWENISNNTLFDERELLLIPAYPWNKIFRREFLLDKNINFTEIMCHNDLAMVIKSIMSAESISFLNETLIMYRHGEGFAQLSNLNSAKRLDLFKAFNDVNQFIKDSEISLDWEIYYLKFKLDLLSWGIGRISEDYENRYFRLMGNDLRAVKVGTWKRYYKLFHEGRRYRIILFLISYATNLYNSLRFLKKLKGKVFGN